MNELRIEKLQEIPLLLDVYGCLLTDKQQEAISLCYDEDCSLAEIAEIHGSSRQAAHNLIERGETQLREYEQQLHIVAQDQQRQKDKAALQALLGGLLLEADVRSQIEELLCRL